MAVVDNLITRLSKNSLAIRGSVVTVALEYNQNVLKTQTNVELFALFLMTPTGRQEEAVQGIQGFVRIVHASVHALIDRFEFCVRGVQFCLSITDFREN